jgi:hypothetical protein
VASEKVRTAPKTMVRAIDPVGRHMVALHTFAAPLALAAG